MFEYAEKMTAQLRRIATSQEVSINTAAKHFAQAIIEDRMIHTFGTGHSHMIGLELFTRAGGIANVNAILDSTVLSVEGARRGAEVERIPGLAAVVLDNYRLEKGDVMVIISNSGRNAMPIEVAKIAQQKGLFTIGITSLTQTKQYPSRHPSGQNLFQVVDLVIDNCVPSGDVTMDINDFKTGPASTISGVFIVNTVMTEACKLAADAGVKLPIYYSQNIDGYSNEDLYQRFEGRVKHL